MGMEGFNEGVHTRFTTILAPYRRQAKRYSVSPTLPPLHFSSAILN